MVRLLLLNWGVTLVKTAPMSQDDCVKRIENWRRLYGHKGVQILELKDSK